MEKARSYSSDLYRVGHYVNAVVTYHLWNDKFFVLHSYTLSC